MHIVSCNVSRWRFGLSAFRSLRKYLRSSLTLMRRREDQEQALLSTCSSLITVVHDGGPHVVQFSHFSVKEFLTSDRLVAVIGDVSLHHILLEPAHTILAQACLGVWTIALAEPPCNPLPWQSTLLDHALFENVSSRVIDGIENLFDPDKPHFSRWIRTHDMDDDSWGLADGEMRPERPEVVPVYPPSVSPVTWRSSLTSIRST